MNRHESAKMPWKTLNHTDKLFGEVTTRTMTEEERQKYGEATTIQKLNLGDEEYMKRLNITTEQLIEDCREYGTSWEACKLIGNRHNLTQKQIYNLVLGRKIKEKLEAEKDVENKETEKVEEPIGITEVCTQHKDCKVTHRKGYKEHNLGLPSKEEFKEMTDEIGLAAIEKIKGIAINFAEFEPRPRLRPKVLLSQNFPYEYGLYDEILTIHANNNIALTLGWDELDEFIKDLQEVKAIAEE